MCLDDWQRADCCLTLIQAQYWSQQLLIGDGCRVLITDICVPISRLAEFVSRSDEQVRASGLLAPIVGKGNRKRAREGPVVLEIGDDG